MPGGGISIEFTQNYFFFIILQNYVRAYHDINAAISSGFAKYAFYIET